MPERSYYTGVGFRFLSDPANTSTNNVSPYIVYLVKVFGIATTFQEITFTVKYCPFISTTGA